jgi:NAD(P)-dependent dehydrogenase (short-subunit alcohol dehydrogenase family)
MAGFDRPRVWVVTGASSGFGHHIASFAASMGDRVIATSRRAELLAPLVASFPESIVAREVMSPLLGTARKSRPPRRGWAGLMSLSTMRDTGWWARLKNAQSFRCGVVSRPISSGPST